MKYDNAYCDGRHCWSCGQTLGEIERLIEAKACTNCDEPDELTNRRFRYLVAHERQRQIEGWLLGPPTAADERNRAARIEELLAA